MTPLPSAGTLFKWLLFFCLYLPSSFSTPLSHHEDHGQQQQQQQQQHQQRLTQVKTSRGARFIGQTDEYYGVSKFLGIRYAEPPLGSLRLQPPQAIDTHGIINATSFGAQCFQLSTPANATNHISEDCLYLNIYTPSDAALEGYCDGDQGCRSMPVMFFIHGGAFNDGSGQSYDATSLVNMSIALGTPTIVVTINYRLSFFGFSAGTTAIAANALNLGLLDQRQALLWVHSHIGSFGGSPRKVTLWGHSGGAASAGLQIVAYNGTSANRKLFRAAILQSGSPQVRVPTPPATWPPYQLAWDLVVQGVGCNTTTNQTQVFSCVQLAPDALLYNAIFSVARKLSPLPSGTAPWQPVFDPSPGPKFLSAFPTSLLAHHAFTRIPTIVGFTTDELTYLIPTSLNISSDLILTGVAQAVLPFVPIPTILNLLGLDPLSVYPNPSDPASSSRLTHAGIEWRRTAAIASDLFERCPGRAFARNMSLFAPVYKYRWNAALPAQVEAVPEMGIVHGSELMYVFGGAYTGGNPYAGTFPTPITAEVDLELSAVVQRAWLSFAGFLDPNKLGQVGGTDWPGYATDSEQVLVFQKPDGSGEFPNGTIGVPLGQGVHTEQDPDDRQMCDFIVANDAAFMH